LADVLFGGRLRLQPSCFWENMVSFKGSVILGLIKIATTMISCT